MKVSFEKLRTTLGNLDLPQIPSTGLKISSVLLPFYFLSEDKMGILLTKRSEHLSSHAGQISFPGGKFDPSDKNLLETALREWEEETGETRDTIKVISSYTEINTGTGYHITPFISIYTGSFNFQLNIREVDFMILLDLDELLHLPFYTIQLEHPVSGRVNLYYFDLPQGLLWGATCHILFHFLKDFCGFSRNPQVVKPNLHTAPFFLPPK